MRAQGQRAMAGAKARPSVVRCQDDLSRIRAQGSGVRNLGGSDGRTGNRPGPYKGILIVEKSRSDGLIEWDEPSRKLRNSTVLERERNKVPLVAPATVTH